MIDDIPIELTAELAEAPRGPFVVELLINDEGKIDKLLVERIRLSEEAIRFLNESFSRTRFSPGKIGNLAVPSRLRIEVMLKDAPIVTVKTVR